MDGFLAMLTAVIPFCSFNVIPECTGTRSSKSTASRSRHGKRRTARSSRTASTLDLLVHGDATLDKIVLSVNLNRTEALKHLTKLATASFVQVESGRFQMFSITKEGARWLDDYTHLAERGKDKGIKEKSDF